MTSVHPFDKTDLLSFFTGDVPAQKRNAIEEHIALCVSCRSYVNGLTSEKTAFLAARPFETSIKFESHRSNTRFLPFFGRQLYALAACVVAVVTAAYFYVSSHGPSAGRIKGETGIKALVQNKSGAIEKRSSGIYASGEKIQFLYSCGAQNRFILLGIDTAGAVTTYFPVSGDSSCVLEPGADIPLPNSIVLDEYTGRETFLAVFSEKPLSVADVKTVCLTVFKKTHSIDLSDLAVNDALTVKYPITVRGGGR